MLEARAAETRSLLHEEAIHAEWESLYLNRDLDRFYDRAFEKLASRLGAPHGETILDAGVGYGHHALRLARAGLRVVGVDLSKRALTAARKNAERAQMSDRIELYRGDLLALRFRDATFRYVNCWGVLMHVPELERALRELARVCAPGGMIAITENNVDSLHVRALEPCVRAVKRVLRRPIEDRRETDQGVEEWHATPDGRLLVRKTRAQYLVAQCASLGLDLVERYAAQLTEVYTSVPAALRPAVHGLNRLWLDHVGWAEPALGNTFIFRKRAA